MTKVIKPAPVGPGGASYTIMANMQDSSYFAFHDIDLKNVDALFARVAATHPGITLQVRLDALDSDKVGGAPIPNTGDPTNWTEIILPVGNAPAGLHTLDFVVQVEGGSAENANASVDWVYFQNSQASPRVASR